jgi:hypothetical protein
MQSLQKQPPYWNVELDAVHAGVDLDSDDGLEVLAPDGVVAVHVEAPVVTVRALHPLRVQSHLMDVPRAALLDQVGDRLAVAVAQAPWEVVLERLPEPGITIARELAKADPVAVSDTA